MLRMATIPSTVPAEEFFFLRKNFYLYLVKWLEASGRLTRHIIITQHCYYFAFTESLAIFSHINR